MERKWRSENESDTCDAEATAQCALGFGDELFWVFQAPNGHIRIEVHKDKALIILADYDRVSLLNSLSEYILFDCYEDTIRQDGESPELRDTIVHKKEKGDTFEILCAKTELKLPFRERDVLGEDGWEPSKTAAVQAEKYFRSHVAERLFQAMTQLLLEAALSTRDGKVPVDKVRKLAQFTEPHKSSFPVRGRGGRAPAVDLSDLPRYYEVTYASVKKAKRIHKNNKTINWKVIVKQELPEMDPDLIDRLDGESDLPESLKTALSDKGGTSACSDIALEWAARLCGAAYYRYTLGYLRTQKTRFSKKQ